MYAGREWTRTSLQVENQVRRERNSMAMSAARRHLEWDDGFAEPVAPSTSQTSSTRPYGDGSVIYYKAIPQNPLTAWYLGVGEQSFVEKFGAHRHGNIHRELAEAGRTIFQLALPQCSEPDQVRGEHAGVSCTPPWQARPRSVQQPRRQPPPQDETPGLPSAVQTPWHRTARLFSKGVGASGREERFSENSEELERK